MDHSHCRSRSGASRTIIEMIRSAKLEDLPQLEELENKSFASDKITHRQFHYHLTRARSHTLVSEEQGQLFGYAMIFYSRITSVARIYSVAVAPEARGKGIARELVAAAEKKSLEQGKTSIRVEIREDNEPSRHMFERLGYKTFDKILDYYEDHEAAIRMEKNLYPEKVEHAFSVPYYPQTFDFTCGSASLMMAMKAFNPDQEFSRMEELRLWREATTIFMTSGLGGCGPQGLALAAVRRGLGAEIYLNSPENFLVDSVRSVEKKEIMTLVEKDLTKECKKNKIRIIHLPLSLTLLKKKLDKGAIPLVLISSWAIYQERVPHWLVVIGMDSRFVYAHDPFIDHEKGETIADSLSMPIAHADFKRMARYGKKGQRAAVLIWPTHKVIEHG